MMQRDASPTKARKALWLFLLTLGAGGLFVVLSAHAAPNPPPSPDPFPPPVGPEQAGEDPPGFTRGYVQELVDQASPGATVRIISGLYPENVRINKSITLVGHDNVVIDGGSLPALFIEGAVVQVENIRLRSTGVPVDMKASPRVEFVNVESETAGAWHATDVGWLSIVTPAQSAVPVVVLDRSLLVHAHPLTVHLLDSAGQPRPNVTCRIVDGATVTFEGRTDAEGRLSPVIVAHAWESSTGSGTNATRLEIVDGTESYALDSHAGTQILGGPAGTPWYQNPVIVWPAAGLVTAAAATAASLRLFEPFRWRWLLLFAPLYTRFAKNEILEHDIRETIYGYVEQNPGAHLRGIKRGLDLKHGTLLHHLQMLEQHGFIKSARDGMYRRYFVMGAAPRFQGADEMAERVLQFVRENPGTNNQAVAKALGSRPSLIHYHVQRWEEAGRIRKERAGREAHLFFQGAGPPPAA